MEPTQAPPPLAQPLPTLVVDDTDVSANSRTSPLAQPLDPVRPSEKNLWSPSSGMSCNADSPGDASAAGAAKNPFQFKTQIISAAPVKSSIGQRHGHRYKHSSISAQHQIFQEPPQRPPLVLPASLPVPTVSEAWKSMRRDQRRRFFWGFCHLAVSIFIFFGSRGSLAVMALSHLVFFDAGSAAVCVAVDVLGNFEVWRRSSIRHPFGLERAEVLVRFALSIFLLFGGFDFVSHNLQHFLESLGGHETEEAQGGYIDDRTSPGPIDLVAPIAMASTLISAYALKNHAHFAKVMRIPCLAALPSILSNPFHLLTLVFSALMTLFPLLSVPLHDWLDRLICAVISMTMFGLGARVAIAQGLMLLMSYGHSNGNSAVTSVLSEIESEPMVLRVDEAQFWQVNYGLCVASIKVGVFKGYDETSLMRLRNRISSIIQNRLGEGYGKGGTVRWEVTLQMNAVLDL